MKITNILGIAIALLLLGCGNYSEQKEAPSSKDMNLNTPLDESIDFAKIKSEVLDKYCINCHQPQDKHINYSSYSVVFLARQQIINRITSSNPNTRMPKQAPALPNDLQQMMIAWVNNGAPEFADENSTDTNPIDTDDKKVTISFSDIKEKVLEPNRCLSCHTHYNNYAVVLANIGSIQSTINTNRMPFPRRTNGPKPDPVPQEGKDLIKAWIDQGAPQYAVAPDFSVPPIPLEPTWVSLRNNVFGPKCIMCHNSYARRAPGDFSTLSSTREYFEKRKPDLFNFDDASRSRLIGRIIGRRDTECDDPLIEDKSSYHCYSETDIMPSRNDKDDVSDLPEVTAEELKIIEEWISAKLPFNNEEK